jgi:hypothetical protein
MNNQNLEIIVSTQLNNPISKKRQQNIEGRLKDFNITYNDKIFIGNLATKSFGILNESFKLFKNSKYEYGIICEDDFYPIDNFLFELNNIVKELPFGWRSLHLCAGWAWGRLYRDKSMIGHFNPEYYTGDLKCDIKGMYFKECNPVLYYNKKLWLGGPIAILVNKKTIDEYIEDFVKSYNETPHLNNDVILTKILNNNDYICREKQLGYENEEGGTTYNCK